MPNTIEIKLLADCPEHVPMLSALWLNEIGTPWIPNASIFRAEESYNNHLNRDQLPLTFVAINANKAIGMVSLRENDGVRKDLTPWLGSLIVHPEHRHQRLGAALIDLTKAQAKKMGYEALFLLTLDPTIPAWYTKLGWELIGVDKLYHHPVNVMKIKI